MSKRRQIYGIIDCNNFFVSCERVFRPDLWHKPVAVLSNNDGCIIARSRQVKELDIPMAAPLFKYEKQLKNHGVTLFSANFRLYGDFSQRVVTVLQQFCPRIEVYSVDESFVEISGLPTDDYESWARELKAAVLQWTGIPVSVGLAYNKTLAKAATEYAKKHPETGGVYTVFDDEKRENLLRDLEVGNIWGIGWRTAPKLRQIGISTAYDLTAVTDKWAQAQLTIRGLTTVRELRGETLLALDDEIEPQQSIARTRSFGHNVRDLHQLEGAIATFTAQAAAKLRQQEEVAPAIMVFLRTGKHAHVQHGASTLVRLPQATADTGKLIEAALQGLTEIYDPDFAYRKAGIVLVGLMSQQSWQLSMFADGPKKLDRQVDLMTAVDSINKKFGTRLVRHASEHSNLKNWHSKREKRSPSYTTSWLELPVVKV